MKRKPVTFRIDPVIIKKLKYLALDYDRTLTDLFLEAIQDLLGKYEKKGAKK
jgi:predicted transcriptional regulator